MYFVLHPCAHTCVAECLIPSVSCAAGIFFGHWVCCLTYMHLVALGMWQAGPPATCVGGEEWNWDGGWEKQSIRLLLIYVWPVGLFNISILGQCISQLSIMLCNKPPQNSVSDNYKHLFSCTQVLHTSGASDDSVRVQAGWPWFQATGWVQVYPVCSGPSWKGTGYSVHVFLMVITWAPEPSQTMQVHQDLYLRHAGQYPFGQRNHTAKPQIQKLRGMHHPQWGEEGNKYLVNNSLVFHSHKASRQDQEWVKIKTAQNQAGSREKVQWKRGPRSQPMQMRSQCDLGAGELGKQEGAQTPRDNTMSRLSSPQWQYSCTAHISLGWAEEAFPTCQHYPGN